MKLHSILICFLRKTSEKIKTIVPGHNFLGCWNQKINQGKPEIWTCAYNYFVFWYIFAFISVSIKLDVMKASTHSFRICWFCHDLFSIVKERQEQKNSQHWASAILRRVSLLQKFDNWHSRQNFDLIFLKLAFAISLGFGAKSISKNAYHILRKRRKGSLFEPVGVLCRNVICENSKICAKNAWMCTKRMNIMMRVLTIYFFFKHIQYKFVYPVQEFYYQRRNC